MRNILYYETRLLDPSADWLVFLHGAGGSIQTWKFQEEAFKDHFNLLLIDLRDHGNSKDMQPAYAVYRFQVIIDDLLQVLEAANISHAHFMTLSFGSVILQALSMQRPELIKTAVMAGGVFKGNLSIRLFVHSAKFLNNFLKYEQMYTIFSYLLMPRKRHQLARRIYRMQARKINQEEYLKWVELYGEFFGLLRSFYHQRMPFPCYIVMGEDDFVFRKAAQVFYKRQQDAELLLIPEAGHICNIDNQRYFNQQVLQYLQSKSTT